ncbi:MAG: heavy metal-binding domain-containing protein [Saprospiraceae bacterium]
MKVIRLFLPVLLVILCFACKNDPKQSVNTAPPTLNDAAAMAQKAAYLCPMNCEKGKLYEQPGKCPVCNMDLEAAAADQIRHATTETAAAAETASLPANDPNKSLEADVDALHDQSMQEMADMERIGRQIKADFKTLPMEQRKPYIEAIADISRAGMDMMAWMRDYRSPAKLPAAEATRYLTEQKTKLLHNRDDIRAALAKGQKLVKPLK